MENPIKQIYDFNHKAGLVDKSYDDFLESSYQIEEALEGFDKNYISQLFHQLNPGTEISTNAEKDLSRTIVKLVKEGSLDADSSFTISDVDRLDKACDAVVFAVGSMTKLGLTSQQITKALNVVMAANNAKLNCPKDEYGKLTKPADFDEKYAPEPKLKAILDERN